MNTQEFSSAFDTLLASYSNKAAFGDQASNADLVLDEYEKSVLLTQAQDIVIKQYFEDSNNNVGFDGNERRQIDFSSLIDSFTFSTYDNYEEEGGNCYADDSYVYILPEWILAIINEKVYIEGMEKTNSYVVKPINYREYDREMSKVWAQPLKKQAWRLISTNPIEPFGEKVEIIINDATKDVLEKNDGRLMYRVRYVRKPSPIILADLSTTGLNIDGYTQQMECVVNSSLHMDILNKAVELAYATHAGKSTSQQ